jgi:squalene-hopene/tetraprenyl-beta-curcumene cyclase
MGVKVMWMATAVAWCVGLTVAEGSSPTAPAALDEAVQKAALASLDKGLAYLDKTQKPDGSWSQRTFPAITALAARAYLDYPGGKYTRTAPQVAKALAFVVGTAKENGRGGIHEKFLENYNTSICLSTLVDAKDPTYDALIANAREYLKTKMVWNESTQGVAKESLKYGGAGYGAKDGQQRPDLSNTQWFVEALAESGLASTDPAYEQVVVFLNRCQNVKDKDGVPQAGDDGGFFYAPDPLESKAGLDDQGRPRSYGGMTYAGFKSFLYARVNRTDRRVQAAWRWICANYTVDTNPGLGPQGLYYYYLTMAKALQIWGEPYLIDAKGVKHDWRADLVRKLVSLQKPDGSWVNEADRWEEGDAILVTAYAVQTIERCLMPLK